MEIQQSMPQISQISPGCNILVSIITLCWNKSHLIKGFIHSLNRMLDDDSAEKTELIIINNGSKDDTKMFLERWLKHPRGPQHKVVKHYDTNQGFAAGNNYGCRVVRGDYILFINNDIIWMDDPIPAFIKAYKTLESTNVPAILGTRLFSHDTGWNVLQGKPVPYLEGWCLFMNRDIMDKLTIKHKDDKTLGVFDEESFPLAYFEDIDLSLRAQLQGIELVERSDMPVRHLGSQTSQRTPGFKFLETAHINKKSFLKKWDKLKGDEW